MLIIPSTYLPSIDQVRQILRAANNSERIIIDLGEHYVKRSERNRTRIMTAQGVMELTVPVQRANKPRQPMREMRIDNSKRWQHQHWITILSAYRSSPFFEHYAPYFEPLYTEQFERLSDLNSQLLRLIFRLLRLDVKFEVSSTYIDTSENLASIIDLRSKRKKEEDSTALLPYIQVFSDRQPFAPNLSILDLLFCEGPNAVDFATESRR